jgi:hypothetical protein
MVLVSLVLGITYGMMRGHAIFTLDIDYTFGALRTKDTEYVITRGGRKVFGIDLVQLRERIR